MGMRQMQGDSEVKLINWLADHTSPEVFGMVMLIASWVIAVGLVMAARWVYQGIFA